jgi:Fe-S-cluster containining protein
MDLDPQKHKGMVFSKCGECNSCCDGSLFSVGFVPLIDFIETAKLFPIVFQEIYGEYWPSMIYTLQPGLPCPYLDRVKKCCSIYSTYRPVACRHFPFRFKAKDSADREPFVGFPFIIEMDDRCPALEIDTPGLSLLNEHGNISKQFIADIGMPKRIDYVEETRNFCRKLDLYGLLKKTNFQQQTESGKKITAEYHIIDKKSLEIGYDDLQNQYSPYINAHWQSLEKPKKLIESALY